MVISGRCPYLAVYVCIRVGGSESVYFFHSLDYLDPIKVARLMWKLEEAFNTLHLRVVWAKERCSLIVNMYVCSILSPFFRHVMRTNQTNTYVRTSISIN